MARSNYNPSVHFAVIAWYRPSWNSFNRLMQWLRVYLGLPCIRRWGPRLGLVLLTVVLAWTNVAGPAWAAEPGLSDESAPIVVPISPQPDAGDIPSERVSKFVQAYLAVVDLISRQEADLQRAETETESLQLQEKIQAEAFRLIEQAGLTQQEYLQLLGLANSDPDFRERVLAQVEETSL